MERRGSRNRRRVGLRGDGESGRGHSGGRDRWRELLQVNLGIKETMRTLLKKIAGLAACAALAGALAPAAHTEDIDLFSRLPTSNDLPNALLIWDNSANWSANIPVPNCYYNENKVPT